MKHVLMITLLFGTLSTVAAPTLSAEDAAAEQAYEAPVDFRGKVTLAYGLVFASVVGYLLLSMKRNAGLKEEVEFLERRLGELEKNAK